MPCVAVKRLLFKIQASGEVRLVAPKPKRRKAVETQNSTTQSDKIKIEPKSESRSIQEMLSGIPFANGDEQSANSNDKFPTEDLSCSEHYANSSESDLGDMDVEGTSTKSDSPSLVCINNVSSEQLIRTFAGRINSSKKHKLSRVPCPIALYSLDKQFSKCCSISDPKRNWTRKRDQHSRQPALSWAHTLGIRYGKGYLILHGNFFSF